MKTISAKSHSVLLAIAAGALSIAAICEKLGMDAKPVAGSLKQLRNYGLIRGENTGVKVAAKGTKYVAENPKFVEAEVAAKPAKAAKVVATREHKRTTKIAKALTLFDAHTKADGTVDRQKVIAKFQSKLDMTEGGASTYFQNCRVARGMTA